MPPPDLTPEWLAVERALVAFKPTGDIAKDGFRVARIAHGVLGRLNIDPHAIPVKTAGRNLARILARHHTFNAGVPEMARNAWSNVMVAEGWEPVEWAAQRFRWVERPRKAPGHYLTPAGRDLATAIWYTLRFLPPKNGEVYASVRQLETYLDAQKSLVAVTINDMIQNRVIGRVYKGKHGKASRFLDCSRGQRLTDVTDVGPSTLSLANGSPIRQPRPTRQQVRDEIDRDLDAMFG